MAPTALRPAAGRPGRSLLVSVPETRDPEADRGERSGARRALRASRRLPVPRRSLESPPAENAPVTSSHSVFETGSVPARRCRRDGAAAQYGSDAIAGVLNFLLKDDRSGAASSCTPVATRPASAAPGRWPGTPACPSGRTSFANPSLEYGETGATSRSVLRDDDDALIAAGNTHVRNPAQIWGSPQTTMTYAPPQLKKHAEAILRVQRSDLASGPVRGGIRLAVPASSTDGTP